MVGDDWVGDILCAAQAGIPGFWIAGPDVEPPRQLSSLVGQGRLTDLHDLLRDDGGADGG